MEQGAWFIRDVHSLRQDEFAEFVSRLVDALYSDFVNATSLKPLDPGVEEFLKDMHLKRFSEKLRDPEKQITQDRLQYLTKHADALGRLARNTADEKHLASIDLDTIKQAVGSVETEAQEVIERFNAAHPNVRLAPFC